MAFITREQFALAVQECEIKGWKDLNVEVIYRIDAVEKKNSEKYGIVWVLQISTAEGFSTRVWSPGRLIKRLREDRKTNQIAYFISHGQKQLSNITSINDFDLVYKDVGYEQDPFSEA